MSLAVRLRIPPTSNPARWRLLPDDSDVDRTLLIRPPMTASGQSDGREHHHRHTVIDASALARAI
jgi:hypothetical protein